MIVSCIKHVLICFLKYQNKYFNVFQSGFWLWLGIRIEFIPKPKNYILVIPLVYSSIYSTCYTNLVGEQGLEFSNTECTAIIDTSTRFQFMSHIIPHKNNQYNCLAKRYIHWVTPGFQIIRIYLHRILRYAVKKHTHNVTLSFVHLL